MKKIFALVIAAVMSVCFCSCGQSISVKLCPNCSEICSDGAKSCSSCGEVISSTWVCVCGKSNSDENEICKSCNLDASSSQDMLSRGYNSLYSGANGSSSSNSSNSSGGSSSGSSSSNSSGSSGVHGVKCEFCKGAGISTCSGWDGGGLVLKYYSYGQPVYGNCIVCHGNGYKNCAYCGGDGIFGD